MNWRKAIIFGATLSVALRPARRPRSAQTPSRTIAAPTARSSSSDFSEYDKRAHLQIDGKAVTLGKRLALSGSRYSGGGVTLEDHQGRHHAQARQAAGDGLRA